MIDATDLPPGVRVVDERDIPPALLEVLLGGGEPAQAFASDDLPPGFQDVLGSGPGVTVVRLAGQRPAPTRKARSIKELVAAVEGAASGLRGGAGCSEGEAGEAFLMSLFELAATPPGRASDLRAKARCLRAHVDASPRWPLVAPMIEAALALDAQDWSVAKMGH